MMKLNSRCARITGLALALGLAGCANLMPPTQVDALVAPQWQAPLPHQGQVGALSQWWQQQGDPLLVELIEAAQAVSPSVAQALSRVESARAARTSANAALLPTLDASASATRGAGTLRVTRGNRTSATSVKSPIARSAQRALGKACSRACTRSRKCSGIAATLRPSRSFSCKMPITTAMPAVKPVVTG